MEHTPRNIVIQLGSLIALYVSISFFLTLLFGLITLLYPDAADTYYELEGASSSIRLGIAMLVVFFPTYITLTRLMHVIRRTGKGSDTEQLITKWFIYLSLLIAGLVLLGTLVTALYTFLNGDATIRFFLKVAAVLATVGMSFHYYFLETRDFWIKHESRSFMFAVGVSLVVLMSIAFGLRYIETPTAVHEMKLDEQQVNDLRTIQYQIENTLSLGSTTMPTTLEAAFAVSGMDVPQAPEGRAAYRYETTEHGFRLCATFSRDSIDTSVPGMAIDTKALIKNAENWNYKAGDYCFERIVK